MPVYSGSMRPAIPSGAAVIATPQSVTEMEPHQIILFHSPRTGELLAHRIVDVSGDPNRLTITTKGDANTKVDPWIATPQPGPIWKVRTVIPYVGAVVHLARNDVMEKLTFVVAAIGLAVACLPRVARVAKETST